MITRDLSDKIKAAARQFPIVCVMGPRQSGKTTLVKHLFPKAQYFSFEDPDVRARVRQDIRGFLTASKNVMIIDEAQRVPEVFSYVQSVVDERGKNGQFIFTGSQNYLLLEKVTQSLAGRVAILKLYPLSFAEIQQADKGNISLEKLLQKGFYPAAWKQRVDIALLYSSYINTYLERDVRQVQNISSLSAFQNFLKMCAGRVGQILNLTSLGNDCGISHTTAKAWLSILESSFIIQLLQPYYENFNKRIVKSPKLYFTDTGLLCHLLDIENAKQIQTHYLKGAIFENFIFSELIKQYANKGKSAPVYYWRDKTGNEIDFLLPQIDKHILIEVKAGKTIHSDFYKGIKYYRNTITKKVKTKSFLIYNGDNNISNEGIETIVWKELSNII
jgi:predicted AAA+ superfamily ATPase